MTFEEFDIVMDGMLEECKLTMAGKGRDYARTGERFGNFNRLADELKISREKVLWVYMAKHLDAIKTYLDTGGQLSGEPVSLRIGDAINYLLLLAGMIAEDERQTTLKGMGTKEDGNHR